MGFSKGVEAEVTSDDQILSFYDDPDVPDTHDPLERQRYIEAITGAKFRIEVTLNEDFYFGRSKVARIMIGFDADVTSWYGIIKKSEWL